ncbi:energy-coupling factor transporter transmembrane protein EcfT [Corynebacterium macclintockiae]|uniref:energy-coupling factor transporter transmembrane component T family protein n=1 Tax=Corynebacterium macclintockiae TaxID=2913501 RepID=UPI0025506859|nr:energy-coupling factor transporter transmembrane protein EcfT [Corynebacterium macclintockiae]MDK8890499.1 energy-coupling factor transporter transmembrane protein EcfT [Corynebacterium macclintockiae]
MKQPLHVHVPLSVFHPGTSVFHRAPAGLKIFLLLVFLVGTALWAKVPWQAGVVVGFTAICYLAARIPVRLALRQLLAPTVLLAAFAGLLWWQRDLPTALTYFGVILSAVAMASLLTLTTTVVALMDAVEAGLRPLGTIGLPVETISLLIALTIRLIPLTALTVNEVQDARKARGASRSVLAFGVPVIVRSLLRARYLGEALKSRGVGN